MCQRQVRSKIAAAAAAVAAVAGRLFCQRRLARASVIAPALVLTALFLLSKKLNRLHLGAELLARCLWIGPFGRRRDCELRPRHCPSQKTWRCAPRVATAKAAAAAAAVVELHVQCRRCLHRLQLQPQVVVGTPQGRPGTATAAALALAAAVAAVAGAVEAATRGTQAAAIASSPTLCWNSRRLLRKSLWVPIPAPARAPRATTSHL